MSSFSSKYKSFDEFYDTLLRGNEIEFKYKEKLYFILPYFKDKNIVGFSFGKFGTNEEIICMSKEELYNFKIDNSLFGEILSKIDILWDNL